MKQVIPFVKEIVFDTNIASMVSISLEHEDYIDGTDVSGEFFVYGEYKVSNDTTEVLSFKEVIPFNLMIPDNLIHDTVSVDIDDFTYEILNNNTIKVCIDLYLMGEEIVIRDKDDVRDLKDIYEIENDDLVDVDMEDINIGKGNVSVDDVNIENNINVENNVEVNNTTNNIEINNMEVNEVGEYIIYHIHIVKEGETLEHIVNQYDTNIEIVKEYNDISKLSVGDKIIIPEIYYGNN